MPRVTPDARLDLVKTGMRRLAADRDTPVEVVRQLNDWIEHIGYAHADLNPAMRVWTPDIDGARAHSERTTRLAMVLNRELTGLSGWQRQQFVSIAAAQVQLRDCLIGEPKPTAEIVPLHRGMSIRQEAFPRRGEPGRYSLVSVDANPDAAG